MIEEVAPILISCVLFVQMGLSDAVQEKLHLKVKFASCPKCLTFWSSLAWLLLHGRGPVHSIAASLVASYCALWLVMLYDALALLYNYIYEQITKNNDTSQDSKATGSAKEPEAPADEVSQM